MKVKLACKLFNDDASYFLEPLLQHDDLESLFLYRDGIASKLPDNLEKKIIGKYSKNKIKFISRLFAMMKKPTVDLYVGIYEVPHGILAILSAKWNRRPSVVSIIGNPKYSFRNKGFRGYVTKWIYRKADFITVTGSASKEFLINEKGLLENKVLVLPNSIPIESFRNLKIEKKYDLITLGRISPEKGLINFLEIISEVLELIPDLKVGIAGKGPKQEELANTIKLKGLENNVFLLGYVSNIEIFLNEGKVFVTTSKTEGLPRTAIQSMACGTPVIASNVGDMKDLVVNNETGVLIDDPNDNQAFYSSILELLDNYSEYQERCIQYVHDNFSSRAGLSTWDTIFKTIKEKSK